MTDYKYAFRDWLSRFISDWNADETELEVEEAITATLSRVGPPPEKRVEASLAPIQMRLTCPVCSALHIDVGEFATKPHHTHACQECGHVWRPAVVATVGVRFLPGFKNEAT